MEWLNSQSPALHHHGFRWYFYDHDQHIRILKNAEFNYIIRYLSGNVVISGWQYSPFGSKHKTDNIGLCEPEFFDKLSAALRIPYWDDKAV